MISEEPDEDADTLDDETLLATCGGVDPPQQEPGSRPAADVREWPLSHGPSGSPGPSGSHRPSGAGVDIDAESLAWFKANHADWQAELRTVLRSWAAEQLQPLPDIQPQG